MKIVTTLLLGATICLAAPQGPGHLSPRNLEERTLPLCVHDNLFRIFLDTHYSSSAKTFCSTYIASTTYISVVPMTTVVSYATVTDTTSFFTSIVQATTTVTTSTALASGAPPGYKKQKRQAVANVPGKAGTYLPSRISSACSCLVPPSLVVTGTTTVPTVTVTIQSTTTHLTEDTTTIQTSMATVEVASASPTGNTGDNGLSHS